MFESGIYPAITLITGPRESGRTTYAVLVSAECFQRGIPCFHNSTALFGWNIEEYLDAYDGLLTLAERIPEPSTILIEESDAKKATCRTSDSSHQAAINSALAILAEKSCCLILTTVQGNESLISEALLGHAYEHVTPFMEARSKETVALGTLHRFGRYMVPVGNMAYEPESILGAMKLANTFKEMRKGAPEGKNVEYTEDRMFQVPQTSLDQMPQPQYPEYPVYYRHRLLRALPNGGLHRLTQESVLHFPWLESVNEHPNETVALEILERTMPQWGFDYQPSPVVQDTNFPDGQAVINGELANLEVISIQPRYSGGHSLHELVALTRVGRAEKLKNAAILKCQTCRTTEHLSVGTWENLPDHNESHRWVMYLPESLSPPSFPFDLAATPLLTIDQKKFTNELEKAIQVKSEKIARQGKGLRNWVVVLAQGFPVDADWYHELPGQWPSNVDGICVVATEGYMGANNHLIPFKDFTAVLLKCPPDFQDHNCYHPGYGYRVSGMDTDFRPLSKDSHTIEEVSAAAWNFPLPAIPVKKTLVIRDQDEREVPTFWSADITNSQAKEILEALGYSWRDHYRGRFWLCSEDDAPSQDGCWAGLQWDQDEKWTGVVFHKGYELREEFEAVDEAKAWCERHTAMLLMHIEG